VGLTRCKLIVAAATCMTISSNAFAQTCLHGTDEVRQERERRLQAVAAVRIINTAEANRPSFVPLVELADSPVLRAMRAEGGSTGDAARAMRFDREEILPGWRVHFVLGGQGYSVALRDARDPCGLTYVSDESGVILRAYPITRERSPLLPTTR